jgi:hypothetical protein
MFVMKVHRDIEFNDLVKGQLFPFIVSDNAGTKQPVKGIVFFNVPFEFRYAFFLGSSRTFQRFFLSFSTSPVIM